MNDSKNKISINRLVEINKENPYENDVFGESGTFSRKLVAKRLTHLIQATSDHMVIALNSEWGEGKTTF